MAESPWLLRITLFGIGLAIIVAVYLWSVVRRRRQRRYPRMSHPRQTARREHEQDFSPDPTDAEVGAVRVRKIEPLVDLPVVKNEAAIAERSAPTPAPDPPTEARPTRSRKRKPKASQLALSLDGEDRGGAPEPTLLALYLRPSHDAAFKGLDIMRAAQSVGLRHGELQIFHHYGAGDLITEKPLFSLADMFEPGHFELDRMPAFQTPGLTMFLNLPTALDGAVAFELFLNTAQRLTESLDANLFSAPQNALDSLAIERMRRTAAHF